MKDIDILIKNATVVDGSRSKSYIADLAISGDMISSIGVHDETQAHQVINATGLTVAPGFIDVHNHSEGWLLKQGGIEDKLAQGFTTEVLMSDGISYAPVNENTINDWMFYLRCLNALEVSEYKGWESISDFLSLLNNQVAQNIVSLIPYANIRSIEHGWNSQVPEEGVIKNIQAHIAREMASGAIGLSTGLEYVNECYATTAELIAACSAIAPYQGLHVSHIRYPLGIIEALKEVVEISRKSKVPLHVSHLKGSTKELSEEIIDYIDSYAVHEVDFSFDVYPYSSASTMLQYLLPYEVWEEGPLRAKKKVLDKVILEKFEVLLSDQDLSKMQIAWVPDGDFKHYEGRSLESYVSGSKLNPAKALAEFLIETNFGVLLVFEREDNGITDQFLSHDKYMIGTDGIYFPNSPVHPRVSGSIGRILGSCVRERSLFSLEDGIYKLSAYPARRFGLKQRGEIKVGNFVDLVLFNADIIQEKNGKTEGVSHVLVNGKLVYQDNTMQNFESGKWPGRALKFNFNS